MTKTEINNLVNRYLLGELSESFVLKQFQNMTDEEKVIFTFILQHHANVTPQKGDKK